MKLDLFYNACLVIKIRNLKFKQINNFEFIKYNRALVDDKFLTLTYKTFLIFFKINMF